MVVCETLAGLVATRGAVLAAVMTAARHGTERRFPLTIEGLADLVAWLESQAVTKVALKQGRTAWPWQAEHARRSRLGGPVDLDYWLAYSGPDALAHAGEEAAWQPTMLVLRDRFTLFVVPAEGLADGCTPSGLASSLAAGKYLDRYPKNALERWIERLGAGEPTAVAECLTFFVAESRGHWHNRARAKIARRLKHRPLTSEQAEALTETIARRLIDGRFTEQFKDQLRLLGHLDGAAAARAASLARNSPVAHVGRYGTWLAERVGAHDDQGQAPPIGRKPR